MPRVFRRHLRHFLARFIVELDDRVFSYLNKCLCKLAGFCAIRGIGVTLSCGLISTCGVMRICGSRRSIRMSLLDRDDCRGMSGLLPIRDALRLPPFLCGIFRLLPQGGVE